jgi:hypothetical protein
MSEKTWERNTSGLVAHAKHRKEQKRQKVDETITRLRREQKAINFNTVAKVAGVSKTYLYSQPQLRDRIEALRHQELEQTVRERVAHPTSKTDASKDIVILAKERRIKELEEENRKLKHQLKTALGKAYDRL